MCVKDYGSGYNVSEEARSYRVLWLLTGHALEEYYIQYP